MTAPGPAAWSRARSLADRLMADCGGDACALWDELGEFTQEECAALDLIAFECQCCNHWFPVKDRLEVDGQYYCKDCAAD